MTDPRLTTAPPSKGKPVVIALILVAIAGAAGLVTWLVVGREPAPPPPPPPAPPRPPAADLLVVPPPEPMLTKADAAVDAGPDAGDGDVEAPAKKSGTGRRRYGTIDKRRVTAFIRSKQAQVRRCYERRLKLNNMLQGVLDTQITILPNGRVSNVNFTQDTLYDSEVRTCVARVIRTWQFPEPEGGQVTVSNLFRFSPRHTPD